MARTKIGHLALTAAAALAAGRAGGFGAAADSSAYQAEVAAARWTEARTVHVRNPARTADTLAVVVSVAPRRGIAYGAADEAGRPIVAQADDLDGDGTTDEVCFLLRVNAGEERRVSLLGMPGPGPAAPADLRVTPHEAGSWEPVRMQPTGSPGTTQHSTHIAAENLDRARRVLERLERPAPMELVECADFRLLLGRESGLIEGMRPAAVPSGYVGSFLREFIPGEPRMAAMERLFAGPVRCGYAWAGEAGERRVTVYRNGVVSTSWTKAPAELQVVVCAYPYAYLQAGAGDPGVRYSQMTEKRRALPGVDTLGFFGRGDANLLIRAAGLKATEHQVWLDAGEIAWIVATDARDKKSPEDPTERMGRLCADTYVAGGMHVTSWTGGGAAAEILYRIAGLGEHAITAGTGLLHIPVGQSAETDVPSIPGAQPRPAVDVRLERTHIVVNRLYPNRFNGWELRPLTLARHNPQPAYFAAEVTNRSAQAANVTVALDTADWIAKATLLSERRMLEHDRNPGALTPHFEQEADLQPAGAAMTVSVPAGAARSIEVCVYPREDSLGLLPCRLHWTTPDGESQADLKVLVQPTLLYMPMYAPVSDLGREYANNSTGGKPPLLYDLVHYGGPTPERTLWNRARSRDFERHGFWTVEPVQIQEYFYSRLNDSPNAFYRQEPLDWAVQVARLMADPACADYRARLYLQDEIWELFGGYKDRWRHLSEIIDMDRILLRNSPTPAWSSDQEQAIDPPFQYHLKLPNDMAELFYYCGRDERLQEYARKLVDPRRELFAAWCADPGFRVGAGTEHPRQLFAFWISTQLHVTTYAAVRRQIWWLRHHGIDLFHSWAFCEGNYTPYADRILHNMAMPANTPAGPGLLLTDRGLGWMDMKEDMDLVTLVRLLGESPADETVRAGLDELARRALDASQRNDFDEARHRYVEALKMLRSDLLYLAPRDTFRGPVDADPLPGLIEQNAEFNEALKIPRAALPPLETPGRRPAPAIDGILDNAYLEQGVTLDMREAMQGQTPQAPTSVYLARDREHLYCLFACSEPAMGQLRADVTERDGEVYNDDCVEIFIDRAGDGAQYAHVAVNALGTVYDSRQDLGPGWNLPLSVAGLGEAASWTAELRIPFEALGGAPAPGETWRMNFNRERKAVGELSAWSVTFGDFRNPDRFGVVEFR